MQYSIGPPVNQNSIHQMVENYSNLIGPTCPHKETHVSNDLKSDTMTQNVETIIY